MPIYFTYIGPQVFNEISTYASYGVSAWKRKLVETAMEWAVTFAFTLENPEESLNGEKKSYQLVPTIPGRSSWLPKYDKLKEILKILNPQPITFNFTVQSPLVWQWGWRERAIDTTFQVEILSDTLYYALKMADLGRPKNLIALSNADANRFAEKNNPFPIVEEVNKENLIFKIIMHNVEGLIAYVESRLSEAILHEPSLFDRAAKLARGEECGCDPPALQKFIANLRSVVQELNTEVTKADKAKANLMAALVRATDEEIKLLNVDENAQRLLHADTVLLNAVMSFLAVEFEEPIPLTELRARMRQHFNHYGGTTIKSNQKHPQCDHNLNKIKKSRKNQKKDYKKP